MKRLSSVLLAAAMTLGALASTGCARPADTADEPETAAAAASTDDGTTASAASTPASTEESVKVAANAGVQVPVPPPLRVENPGRAPSPRHSFLRGFWRYDGPRTGYVWVPGHWEVRHDKAGGKDDHRKPGKVTKPGTPRVQIDVSVKTPAPRRRG